MTEAAKLPEREQIARIIDPNAFKHDDSDPDGWLRFRDFALAKADQILALRSSSDPDAVRALVIEECAKVAEQSDALAIVRANVAREIRALASGSRSPAETVGEIAQWQWRMTDGNWTSADPPDADELKKYPGRFRPLYVHAGTGPSLSDIERVVVDYFEASDDCSVENENGEWLIEDNESGASISLTGLAAAIFTALTEKRPPSNREDWPSGCQDWDSCLRHRECMYLGCKWHGEPIVVPPSSQEGGK